MGALGRVVRLAALLTCGALGASPTAQAQPPLPTIALERLPEAPRAALGKSLADAQAHPQDAALVGRLAMLLHAWEQYDTAAPVYARLRAIDPRFEWAYLGGLVETRRANHAEAAALLAEAVTLDPSSVPARLARADALFEAGDADGASVEYAALVSGASEPHARYGLGRALARKGDHAAALAELDKAVALYPEFGAAWYARGMALRSLKRVDEAKEALGKSQAFGARWPSVVDPVLARVRALREDAIAHVQRALQLERQADTAGAIREYEAAVAIDPSHLAARANLIALHGRQQDWPRAKAQYEAIAAAGGAVPAEAHFNYGVCLAAQKQIDEAERLFRKAVEANPQYANAWSSLGQIAEIRGDPAEAETRYRRALEQTPGNAAVRFNIARMLIGQKRFADAIAELAPIAETDVPERPRVLFGLATAYVLSGDVASGRRYALQARDLAREKGQKELADAIEGELARLPR
jgi:tetratricopeptide (TPR) repeat protein